MPNDRYYVDGSLEEGESVVLNEGEWHHLVHVSRGKVGDTIDLVNGKGVLAHGVIRMIRKGGAEVFLQQVVKDNCSKRPIILALGMLRKGLLDWVIEKGTELNVTEFWLFPGALSEKGGVSESHFQRLRQLAISAMKQCGRLDLPLILLKPRLVEFSFLEGTLLFGDVSNEAPYLWNLSLECFPSSPIVLFIGPEKGFSSQEEEFLRNNLKAQGVRLHSNVLRAETAPLVGLSLIQLI